MAASPYLRLLLPLLCLNICPAKSVVITVNRDDVNNGTSSSETRVLTMSPFSWVKIDVTEIPDKVKFVLIEAHNQKHNMTMAYKNPKNGTSNRDETVSGKDVGLVVSLAKLDNEASVWLRNGNQDELLVLVVITLYSEFEPLPGGCNMEFSVQVSPFLRLVEKNGVNTIEFQHGRLGSPRAIKAPPCDTSFFYLKYDIYAYNLKENDYSEEEFFRGIELMSNVQSIRRSASIIKPLTSSQVLRTRCSLLSYPGRGVIYNVIVSYENHSAAYVPVSTYNCDLSWGSEACGKIHSIPAFISVTIAATLGLIVCLKGHQWFDIQMIFFGFVGSAIPIFVCSSKFTDLNPTSRDLTVLSAGLVGALIWFLVWRILKVHVISLLLSGFVLGFLIVASALFTALGNSEIFRSDLNYWLIVGGGSLVTTLIFLPLGALCSILASVVVGSYAAVFAVDRFIGGTISYIVLNVLRRAIYEGMFNVTNKVPFQEKDICLLVIWAILALVGLVLQLYVALLSHASTLSARGTTRQSARTSRARSSVSKRRTPSRRGRSRRRPALPVYHDDVIVISRRTRDGRQFSPPTESADENAPLLREVVNSQHIVPVNSCYDSIVSN
ncbi:Transmembrane 7 superfamily member 3 [Halotydeus destructor]|nr:Transmembrane 7 superfamily member 3 [Halotydeus destructor]